MKSPVNQYDPIKRGFDIFLGGMLLLVSLPLQLLVATVVAIKLGRPVLFKQTRPGKDGVPFTLFKFRSMKPFDAAAGMTTNEERATRFGQILRSTSLDELPSLWNVVRGDMSLVGPRPLRMSYLERFSAEQSRRHEVRPGITGYAQANGRNSLSWDDRLELDVHYVDSRTFLLDLKVLAKTLVLVLNRSGVAAEGVASMTEFFGPSRTSRVRLVPLATEHIPVRVEWLSDPNIRQGISIEFRPDVSEMHTWLEKVGRDQSRLDWVGVDPITDQPVSMCGIQLREKTASLYIYVNPELHSQGIGSDTMSLVIARCREMGIQHLHLQTPISNGRAIEMYQKVGFVEMDSSSTPLGKLSMALVIENGHQND